MLAAESSPRAKRWTAHAAAIAFVAVWAAYASQVPDYLLPGPWEVARGVGAFVTDIHSLRHMAVSIGHIFAALAAAFVLGTALAFLAHYVPVFVHLVHGRIGPFLNSFSGIGWTLLAVIWFGLDHVTVVFAIAAVLTPFALVNMRAGLDALDPELLEMARSFGRRRPREMLLVVAPSLLPFAFATLRLSFGVAWKVALTAELFGGNAGFGYLFNLARQEFDTTLILVVIVLIIAFVYSMDRFVFAPLQARLSTHYEVQ